MARILIFDSSASEDSAGNAVTMTMAEGESAAKKSMPFRCSGGLEEQTEFGLEICPIGSTARIGFKIETFNDRPSLIADHGLPSDRTCPHYSALTASELWAPVQTAELEAGVVRHHDEEHIIDLDVTAEPKFVVDQAIRAYWARLRIWAAEDVLEVYPRIVIWAIVGGHENLAVLEALTKPYAYHDIYVT